MLSGSWIVDILQLWSFSSLKQERKFKQTNKQRITPPRCLPSSLTRRARQERENWGTTPSSSMLHWDRNKNYLNTAYHSDKSHDVVHIQDTLKKKKKKNVTIVIILFTTAASVLCFSIWALPDLSDLSQAYHLSAEQSSWVGKQNGSRFIGHQISRRRGGAALILHSTAESRCDPFALKLMQNISPGCWLHHDLSTSPVCTWSASLCPCSHGWTNQNAESASLQMVAWPKRTKLGQ